MKLNSFYELSRLTQELQLLNSSMDSSQSNTPEYQLINVRVVDHREKIQAICGKYIGNTLLFAELQAYSTQLKVIRSLLPPLLASSDKGIIATHLKIVGIMKKLNEAQLINKLSIAFRLSEGKLRELIGNSPEGFFAKAANVCFELAGNRLMQFIPLTLGEVTLIHEALFDSTIKSFSENKLSSNHWSCPHPAYVFATLRNFLTAVEPFQSCDAMLRKLDEYMEKKPNISSEIAKFLRMPKSYQIQLLAVMKNEAEKGSTQHQRFLDSLARYEAKLQAFRDGIKELPIVDVKIMREGSRHNNQTFFLNVGGKTHWVFKPISENEKGEEIARAECTVSRLNYHHQFPIPLTVLLGIKEWVGSAQLFVEHAYTQAQIEVEKLEVEEDQLHRLAIFDLLFSNSDRNGANFLFQNLSGLASIVGIDHDSCLMFKEIRPLRLEYLQFSVFEKPLKAEMEDLFSPAAINCYKLIMKENGVSTFQFEWLDCVAKQLRQALDVKTPLKDVIESLQSHYEDYFLRN